MTSLATLDRQGQSISRTEEHTGWLGRTDTTFTGLDLPSRDTRGPVCGLDTGAGWCGLVAQHAGGCKP